MVNIVLVEPEIPQNCGNIARTCAATRSRLHLVEPLGFDISEKAVKRAGLDYWPMVDVTVYTCIEELFRRNDISDLWLATTKAPKDYSQARFRDGCWLFFGKETAGLPEKFRLAHAQRCIRIPMREDAEYRDGDYLMFGRETRGLPESLLTAHPERCVRIPMREDARSLNLSNSVAVLAYEALRQQGFPGLSGAGEMALGSAQADKA